MAKRASAKKTKSTKEAAGKRSASKVVDAELAARALEKRLRKAEPTRRELEALRRVERQRDEERRLDCYAMVPQKHYRELSGRQTKQLQDIARRHGVPCDGRTVDLFKVIKSLHDLIAANAGRLRHPGEDEDGVSLEFWKCRRERALARRAERADALEEGAVVSRADFEAGRLALLRWVVGVMERAGSELAAGLAGKPPAEVRRIVGDYFDGVRREAVQRESGQRGNGQRGAAQRRAVQGERRSGRPSTKRQRQTKNAAQ